MSPFSLTTQFTSIDGLSIRYCRLGQGKPLLLIHGIGAMLEYWYKNIKILSNQYEMIAFDLPGFGYSTPPKEMVSLEFYVNFIKKFLDTQSITQVNILGNSLGAGLGLRFSERYPSYVKTLILLNSVGFARQISFDFRLLTFPGLNHLLLHCQTDKSSFAALLRKHVYDSHSLTDEFIDYVYPIQNHSTVKQTFLNVLKQNVNLWGIKNSPLRLIKNQVSSLKDLPKLLVWGKQDPVLNYDIHTRAAKKLLPDMPLITLDHCGHMPQLECSERINKIVLAFLYDHS